VSIRQIDLTAAFSDGRGLDHGFFHQPQRTLTQLVGGTSVVLAPIHPPVGSKPPHNPGQFTDNEASCSPPLRMTT
jgi:hypothetical protein